MGTNSYSILFVDDHADTRNAITRLLQKHGHIVAASDSFAGALERAQCGKFDLLIADVGLPDGNGLDLLQQVRAMYPIRGITLTAFAKADDIERTRIAGFARHLAKPMLGRNLQHVIDEVMLAEAASDHNAVDLMQ